MRACAALLVCSLALPAAGRTILAIGAHAGDMELTCGALLARAGAARDQPRKRRSGQPVAKRRERHRNVEQPDRVRRGGNGEAGGEQPRAPHGQSRFAGAFCEPPQEIALRERRHQPEEGEENRVASGVQAEARVREDGEVRLQARHGEVQGERRQHQLAELGAPQRAADLRQRIQIAPADCMRHAPLWRQRLFHGEGRHG